MKTSYRAILAITIMFPLLSQAGGLYLYETGTSDLGFAGAGTAARAEDPSTLYSNPVGITRLDGDQITVAAQALYGGANYKLNGSQVLPKSDPDNAIG